MNLGRRLGAVSVLQSCPDDCWMRMAELRGEPDGARPLAYTVGAYTRLSALTRVEARHEVP
jgi:hypothetical protein